MKKGKIRVLIVDDSALVRRLLGEAIGAEPDMEVIGTAIDPLYAVQKIRKDKPDVITLDIQMPRMDGLTFLRKLMGTHPMPVVVISSLTQQGSDEAVKALDLGAVDVVAKPVIGVDQGFQEIADEIIRKVRGAASSNIRQLVSHVSHRKRAPSPDDSLKAQAKRERLPQKGHAVSQKLVLLGGSTGGTVAVRRIVEDLTGPLPAVIVVLHMPASFTASYAAGMDRMSPFSVKEAADGDVLLDNHIYVAPGGRHLQVRKASRGWRVSLNDDPPYNRHRPAVDVTFFSAAATVGPRCFAAVLTGMGSDGAEGLKVIRDSGGTTIVQDESTSVIYGMPKQALLLGGADRSFPLPAMAGEIEKFSR